MTAPAPAPSSTPGPLPELSDVQAWLGLAIAVVALSSFGLATPLRLTLYAVILYVLLMNAEKIRPQVDRFNRSLGLVPSPGGGGAVHLAT